MLNASEKERIVEDDEKFVNHVDGLFSTNEKKELTETLLEEIGRLTSGDRQRDYGHQLVNHLIIGMRWSLRDMDDKHNDPISVAYKMADVKLARESNTPKYDNAVDNAGYMVCIDKMCSLYIEMGLAVSRKQALMELYSIEFPEMWDLMQKARKHLTRNR